MEIYIYIYLYINVLDHKGLQDQLLTTVFAINGSLHEALVRSLEI